MATSQASQTSTDECKHCGASIKTSEDGEGSEFYAPGYCSESCFHKYQAETVLDDVRADHRVCGTCFEFIKEVEPPGDDWKAGRSSRVEAALDNGAEFHNLGGQAALDVTECSSAPRTAVESVIGFEYRTAEAETVVKEVETSTGIRAYQTGTGCKCGNVDVSSTDDLLRECSPRRVLKNTILTLHLLEYEGKIDKRVDKELFFDTFRETRDFDIALGKALYTPES